MHPVFTRVQATWDRANQSVKKRPLVWFVAFIVWQILTDRLWSWANQQLDDNVTTMKDYVVKVILWFDSPLMLFGSVLAATMSGILLHAYLDTRKTALQATNPHVFPPSVHKEEHVLGNERTYPKDHPLAKHELFLNRDRKQARFTELMEKSTHVWVMTHQATSLRGNRAWWGKVERLILPSPDGFSIELLASVSGETSSETIKNDIASAVADAGKRIEIKTADTFFNSLVIGNPHSADSWASIEIFGPWWQSRLRPSIVITASEHPSLMRNLTAWFEELWKVSPKTMPRLAGLQLDSRSLKYTVEERDSLKKQIEDLGKEKLALEATVAQCEGTITALSEDKERLQRTIEWNRLVHEVTKGIRDKIDRLPTFMVRYYSGHSNLVTADRVFTFFREAGWQEIGHPKEVATTDFANRDIGKRIQLTYRRPEIGVFHDATVLVQQGGFFAEGVTRSINAGDQDADLLITIFPADFWK